VAVLLVFISTLFLRRIHALQPLLHLTYRPKGLLFALIADLPWLLLAVLGIAVLFSLLGTSLHLELADFLGFEMTVLLFDWEGKDVRKLLTVPVHVGFAHLHLDLSWDVVTVLGWFSCANNTLWAIAIILGALVPLTIEFDGIELVQVTSLMIFSSMKQLGVSTFVH